MTVPFKGGNTITQRYGERPDYYKQFGLNGHEGLDLVPSDGDTDIYCIEEGTIVRDYDDPVLGKAYGDTVVVLNLSKQRAWWYCHLNTNYVSDQQKVKRGDKIGVMGATGNAQGAHLHLGLRYCDTLGNPINMSNGFQGFVDPLPALDEVNSFDNPAIDTSSNSQKWTDTCTYLEIQTDPTTTPFDAVKSVIAGFKSRITDLTTQVASWKSEAESRTEQVSRLKDQVTSEQNLRIDLSNKLQQALSGAGGVAGVYEARITELQKQVDRISSEKGDAQKQLAICQQKQAITSGFSLLDFLFGWIPALINLFKKK